ncbi:MAG: SDR family NAD(P)-dependent oxidoreductase, partial [Acidobacteriaceae bacterium]|nr:SDR family NAD(P)-dependent oxidoreductase [Acidobacteriaceae bacterium]
MSTLSKQSALVVGASSGIGRDIARLFASEGARVVAAARRLDRLHSLQQEMASQKKQVEIVQADASRLEDMERLGRDTVSKFGRLDILVYAAGTNTPERALARLNPEIWTSLIEVNLNGAFYITHAVLPYMRQAKSGHLIFIASISGLLADVSGAAYQPSKRGLVALAHAIRVEE